MSLLYRTLIISPDMGLDVTEEIIQAASGFAPKIFSGTVTRQRALEAISDGEYDIIHIITHGKEHVLQMSDGIIEADMLEHAISSAKATARVIFLNACRSAHTATSIYNHTNVAYAIGWTGDVSNQVAFTWARLFFEALRLNPNEITHAVQTANEAILKSYRIDADELPLVLNGRARAMSEENDLLRQQVADLREKAEKSDRLYEELAAVKEDLDTLRKEYARRDIVRLPLWLIFANLALVVLLLLNLTVLATTH